MVSLGFSPSQKTNLFFTSVVNEYDVPKSFLFVSRCVSGITLVLGCRLCTDIAWAQPRQMAAKHNYKKTQDPEGFIKLTVKH